MGATERFQRLELKYHLTDVVAERVRRAAAPWCVPDRHNPSGGGGYPISSLYLDSPGLEFHKARARGDADRIKLRIRTYGAAQDAHLEIKRKVGKIVHKHRVAVPRVQAADIARGRGGTGEAVERFQLLAGRYGAIPKVTVFYEREAWVSTVDDYARITFDRRIRARAASDWTLHTSPPPDAHPLDRPHLPDAVSSSVVLELKCVTLVPRWIRQLIADFELVSTGFSKYSNAVEHCGLGPQQSQPVWRT